MTHDLVLLVGVVGFAVFMLLLVWGAGWRR